MHFSTPALALLAIAAGVQASKQHEPPIQQRSVAVLAAAASTGAQPLATGTSGGTSNGTSSGSSSSSSVPASSHTPASPSATGFVPSSPGVKVSVPQLGLVGAGLGSVAYGALIFLA